MGLTFNKPNFAFLRTMILVVTICSPAYALTCNGKLEKASVNGPVHQYKFTAVCSEEVEPSQVGFGMTGFESKTWHFGMTLNVTLGGAEWDQQTKQAREILRLSGSYAYQNGSGTFSGERVAKGVCNQDPFLADAPGGAGSCQGITVQYQATSGSLLEKLWEPKVLLLQRRFSFVEAKALSAKAASPSSSTPTPPPPNPTPNIPVANIRDAAGVQGSAKATSGAVAVLAKPEPTKNSDARGAPGGMKAAPGGVATLTQMPTLAVVANQAIVEPNCQSPKPAMTVKATIHNSGRSLPANQGTIFAKESGGTNLSSAGISLPAIASGQEQTVNIPVISLQPYASLAGWHQLQLKFNPQLVGGQLSFGVPTNPYTIKVTFPSNYCQPAHQAPGSAGNTSQPRGGPPMPPVLPKPRKP